MDPDAQEIFDVSDDAVLLLSSEPHALSTTAADKALAATTRPTRNDRHTPFVFFVSVFTRVNLVDGFYEVDHRPGEQYCTVNHGCVACRGNRSVCECALMNRRRFVNQ